MRAKTNFPGILTAGKDYEIYNDCTGVKVFKDDTGSQVRYVPEFFTQPFKAGDRLRCERRTANQSLSTGRLYTALFDEHDGSVQVLNDKGEPCAYAPGLFSLVSSSGNPCGYDPSLKNGPGNVGYSVPPLDFKATSSKDTRRVAGDGYTPPIKVGDRLFCVDQAEYVCIANNHIYEAIADQVDESIQIRNNRGEACDYPVECFKKVASPCITGRITYPNDPVNRPAHYTDGVIDFIEDKKLGYHLGNAIECIVGGGQGDLEQAIWWIKRHINATSRTV